MSDRSPQDSEKERAAPDQKAAQMKLEGKKLEEWRAHIKHKMTLLSFHRSHWLGNPAAAISIRLYTEKHLRK